MLGTADIRFVPAAAAIHYITAAIVTVSSATAIEF